MNVINNSIGEIDKFFKCILQEPKSKQAQTNFNYHLQIQASKFGLMKPLNQCESMYLLFIILYHPLFLPTQLFMVKTNILYWETLNYFYFEP